MRESVMEKIVEEDLDGQTAGRATPPNDISRLERSNPPPTEYKDRIAKMNLNTENPIAPQKLSKKDIKKRVFPEQFKNVANFKEL